MIPAIPILSPVKVSETRSPIGTGASVGFLVGASVSFLVGAMVGEIEGT